MASIVERIQEHLLPINDPTDLKVAGSFVTACYLNEDWANDIDYWVYSEYPMGARDILRKFDIPDDAVVKINTTTMTIEGVGKYTHNIILTNNVNPVTHFDLDVVRAYYDPADKQVYMTPEFVQCMTERTVHVGWKDGKCENGLINVRVAKYNERGFTGVPGPNVDSHEPVQQLECKYVHIHKGHVLVSIKPLKERSTIYDCEVVFKQSGDEITAVRVIDGKETPLKVCHYIFTADIRENQIIGSDVIDGFMSEFDMIPDMDAITAQEPDGTYRFIFAVAPQVKKWYRVQENISPEVGMDEEVRKQAIEDFVNGNDIAELD